MENLKQTPNYSANQVSTAHIGVFIRIGHWVRLFVNSLAAAFYFFRIGLKPIKPTLRLSKNALNAPLPDCSLSEIRQFLIRSGRWKHQPIRSLEHFVMAPAPGVLSEPKVIGPRTQPIFSSLGFGDMTIREGMGACGSHTCIVLNSDAAMNSNLDEYFNGFTFDWTPCNGEKNYGICNGNYSTPCGDMQCNDDDGYFTCSPERYSDCSDENAVDEFNQYWDHPFVEELRNYFQVETKEALSEAVQDYIGRNMYDASVIDADCPMLG